MPLDPDKLREASERAVNLSKRFDAFMEKRKADPEDEEEDDDDDDDLREPAEAALKAASNPEVE